MFPVFDVVVIDAVYVVYVVVCRVVVGDGSVYRITLSGIASVSHV